MIQVQQQQKLHTRFMSLLADVRADQGSVSMSELSQTSSDESSDLSTAVASSQQPSSARSPAAPISQSASQAQPASHYHTVPVLQSASAVQAAQGLGLKPSAAKLAAHRVKDTAGPSASDVQAGSSHTFRPSAVTLAAQVSGHPRHLSAPASVQIKVEPHPNSVSPAIQPLATSAALAESDQTAALPLTSPAGTEAGLSPPSADAVAALKQLAEPSLHRTSAQSSACHLAQTSDHLGSKTDACNKGGANFLGDAGQTLAWKPGTSAVNDRQRGHLSSQKACSKLGTLPSQGKVDGPLNGQSRGQLIGQFQGLASTTSSTAKSLSHDPSAAPRGLNGPLLSHPRKRKTPDSAVRASHLQDRSTGHGKAAPEPQFTVVLGPADSVKRVKVGTQATAPEQSKPPASQDSLAVMVETVNRSVSGKAVSQEQLRQLQDAVDGVDELLSLERMQLTNVLKSVGNMEYEQMIMVRKYLGNLR